MANPRWSASRFGTFKGCKNKYNIVYIKELVVSGRESPLAAKGLSFHEIAEWMDSSKTLRGLTTFAKKKLKDATFDQEKYPIIKAIPRFYYWWQDYIKKYEEQGFELFRENWEYGKIDEHNVIGAIDVLLINPKTKEVKIVDYKTSSQAKLNGYENQLLLYVYLLSKRLKIKEEDITKKIETYGFFPLAGLKDEELSDPEIAKKMMMKNMKQLVYTIEDVDNALKEFRDIIKESDNTDWENIDPKEAATMSFACSFCDACGHQLLCPISYQAGLRFPRKAKIHLKSDKKLESPITQEQLKEMFNKSSN